MEHEKQPYEIVPDETQENAEDVPVIRLEKDAAPPRKLPPQLERKSIPEARLQQAAGDINAPPLPFTERQAFNTGGVENVWGTDHEKRASLPWGRIAAISIFIMALIIGSLVFNYRADEKPAPVTPGSQKANPSNAKSDDGETTEAEAQQMVKQIETAVRHYCAATTVDERVKYVRRPEHVKILMQASYPDGKVSPIKFRNIQLDPLSLENRGDFWMATLETAPGESRNLIVELPEKGAALIDWEVDSLHQPYSWDRFATEPPNGESHDFRVHAVPGVLYSHEFSDENKWHCYVLSAPGTEIPIFGYCEVDGTADRKMMDLLRRNGNQSVPVILQLKRPAGTLSPQGAIIETFLSESWIYIDPVHPGP